MVKPKRGGSSIEDIDKSDGSIGVELIGDNFPQIAVSTRRRGRKSSSITQQPVFPGNRFVREEFVNELH